MEVWIKIYGNPWKYFPQNHKPASVAIEKVIII